MQQLRMTRLRYLRMIRGITQEELGRAAGVTQPYLSQIDKGSYKPPRETLERIAKALGYEGSPEDLIEFVIFRPETTGTAVLR